MKLCDRDCPPLDRDSPASPQALELDHMSARQLERVFMDGLTPEAKELAGWEFRGFNTPSWTRIFGVRKFFKGFYRCDDRLCGYNLAAVQTPLTERWLDKPIAGGPRRFGFYQVSPVDPTARDNNYLHAVLLDYGAGKNPRLDPSRGLRDYLVRVEQDNPDLFLGKAYYAIGAARIPTFSYFVLERHRPGLSPISS
jgi:hypothetical protein